MQLAVEDVCLLVCVSVSVSVCVWESMWGLLQGALDKWRCHMVGPDVLVSYVHSSSKTTTGATIGPLLSSKASQPICFLAARPRCIVGPGYFCGAFAVSNLFCIWGEMAGAVGASTSAVTFLQDCSNHINGMKTVEDAACISDKFKKTWNLVNWSPCLALKLW